MTSAQKVSGRLLLPWLPARWGSDLKALRDIVARGDIGRVYRIDRVVYSDAVDGGEYRSDFKTEVEEMTVGGNIYGDEYEIYRHIARVIHGEEQYFAPPTTRSSCRACLTRRVCRRVSDSQYTCGDMRVTVVTILRLTTVAILRP